MKGVALNPHTAIQNKERKKKKKRVKFIIPKIQLGLVFINFESSLMKTSIINQIYTSINFA